MRYFLLFLTFVLLLTGCAESKEVTDVDLSAYEVKQTFDQQKENDYIFQLVTEKEEYRQGEEVELFGEIVYTGEEEVTIAHAASAIIFNIKEQVRGFEISQAIPEIGVQTVLAPNVPYREDYHKQGVFYSESDSKEYTEFIEDFSNRDDFPPGYYIVEATTDFFDGADHRKIKAEIDFKVLPKSTGE